MMNKQQQGASPDPENYQQALIKYQRRISNILESFTDGFFEVDKEWTVTYWNGVAERLLEMPREKMLNQNLWEIYDDAFSLMFFRHYQLAIERNVSVRFEEYFAPKHIWLEVSAFPSGEGLSVYFKDITERKMVVEELEIQRKKYNDLFHLSPLPQWVYELNTLRFLDVNEAAINHYGFSREEFMKMTIEQIRPEEDIALLHGMLADCVDVDQVTRNSARHRKKSGELIDVVIEGKSIDFDGNLARLAIIIDRTNELRSLYAMKESIAKFDIVAKATSDAIWDLDMQSGRMIWNRGFKDIFGYKKLVYNELWWRSKVHQDDLTEISSKFEQMIGKRQNKLSLQYRFKKADGSFCVVLDRSFLLFDEAGQPFRMIGSMQDITERVNHIQEIEIQNQKLKEIAWIQAHIVRGPLTNIMGLVELIDESSMPTNEIREILNKLKLAACDLDLALVEIIKKG
jgi:PAS domain S-box-containing protein